MTPPIEHTVPVTSDLSVSAAPAEPSFTLPARPGLLVVEPVDLLADPERRRLPEGTVSGFATLGALVLFGSLVGGPVGGLVVIGVSTLLAAVAALVSGRVSLSPVGGQRGAAVLLGAAATALIVGSVVTQERRPAPEMAGGVPVPAYAAVPATPASVPPAAPPATTPPPRASASTVPTAPPAAQSGLTLSADVWSAKPGTSSAAARAKAAERARKAAEKAALKTDKATKRAAEKAAKAAKKAADKAAKAAATQGKSAAAQQKNAKATSKKAEKSGVPAKSRR